jgi:hypothetical protein
MLDCAVKIFSQVAGIAFFFLSWVQTSLSEISRVRLPGNSFPEPTLWELSELGAYVVKRGYAIVACRLIGAYVVIVLLFFLCHLGFCTCQFTDKKYEIE